MRAPLAVYTDLDDGDDPTVGMELLRANGFEWALAQAEAEHASPKAAE